MRTRHARLAILLFLTACGGSSSSTGPTGTPASITLSATTVNLIALNQTQDITPTVLDAGGATITGVAVTWSSNAGTVATVSNQGRITAIGNGTAQITATAGTVQATVDVTVQQVAATLTLSPDTLRLANPGDTVLVGRTVRDALGSTMSGVAVTFAVVNPAVATVVVSTGRVTAVADGATTLTAQVAPGGSALTKSVRVEVGGVLPPAYLRGGYLSTAYADTIGPVSGGGTGFVYAVTAGALPNNLSLNTTSGAISGSPSASGAFFFQITASNGTITVSERYAITISTKPSSAFNLWLTYNGGPLPPANAQTAVSAALARFEDVITGDMGAGITYPASGLTPGVCQLVDASLLNGAFIEDVAILMALDSIDGVGNTLARGGFCGYGRNPAPPSTITGQMKLDDDDAAVASVTYLQDVIWHEIAHAFGVGTLWQGSLSGVGTSDPKYNGTNGNTEWLALGGPTAGVPVELTVEAHWREGWFNAEIMTPTTEGSGVRLPISRMTIGTLIDLGWSASLSAADAYTLPGCSPACTVSPFGAPGAGAPGGAFHNDIAIDPLLPLPPGAVRKD
ncbi:MAG: Ig-like domain-containing protein [Longimicrobiales bacterium]